MPARRDQVEIDLLRRYDAAPASPGAETDAGTGRWLALYFRCARAYVRAYKNEAGTAYRGRCPRCGKVMQFLIGPGGTSRRSFEVSC